MTGRIDQASRVIHARPSTIFRAFASRDAMESWLPPDGMTGTIHAFAFREGGGYRMRLAYDAPDHPAAKTSESTDEVAVRFLKLTKARRIEQVVEFESDQPEFAGSMRMTWTFAPVDRGTEVIVRCENVPEGIRPEDHEAGLATTLQNLAQFTE